LALTGLGAAGGALPQPRAALSRSDAATSRRGAPRAPSASEPCAVEGPARWGALSARAGPAYGAWYLPTQEWRVRPAVSTWERPASHPEHLAAEHAHALLAAAVGGASPAGGSSGSGCMGSARQLAVLPFPVDTWTGRRQAIGGPCPASCGGGTTRRAATAAAAMQGGAAAALAPNAAGGVPLLAHSPFLNSSGEGSPGSARLGGALPSASAPGSRVGAGPLTDAFSAPATATPASPSRANSVAMTNIVVAQERAARRAVRAAARVERKLAGSYGLRAYKCGLRGRTCRLVSAVGADALPVHPAVSCSCSLTVTDVLWCLDGLRA
jgi:hypothetical protein